VALSRTFKELFGRQKGGAVAYPSGHTTLTVVVLGMVLLVLGTRLYAVAVTIVWALLGILGQAVTYHYFTDAVGGLLLGSAIVCGAFAVVDLNH
jgi:membrane-associated phospholipid phosphatase